MSTNVSVEISPAPTTRPVLTSVSQATRPVGSSRMTASSTPSEIWSATLSGWPSVTDSEVKRYSFSAKLVMAGRLSVLAATGLALHEVDDQRDAVHAEAGAQAVLDVVRVVARDALARVDLDREARRALADLRGVEQLQAVALLGGRLACLDDLADEAVELGRRDPALHPVAEREHLLEQAVDVAARQRARGHDLRAQAQLVLHLAPLVVEVLLVHLGGVPLVQDDRRRAARLHRQLGDAHGLRGDAVVRVADDERDVGALGGALRAQDGVVLDGLRPLRLAAHPRRVDDDELAAVDLERQVDRVARRARHLADDHPVGAGEAVDERR